MLRRLYLFVALMAAIGVGAVFAGNTPEAQDKDKNKDKGKIDKRKEEVAAQAFAAPFVMGEGGYLGVFLEEVSADRMKELGLTEERGAVVMKVAQGSPAEKSGLKENDVIVSFNGRRVDSVRELQRLLAETPPDRSVAIEVVRGGARQTLTAALTKRSHNFTMITPNVDEKVWRESEEAWKRAQEELERSKGKFEIAPPDFGNFAFTSPGEFMFFRGARLGISVETLTDQLAEYFGVKDGHGVLVTEVRENTPAAKAGLKAGDIITAIDDQKVDDVSSLTGPLNKKEEGAVKLTIMRDRNQQTITVTLEKRETRPVTPRRVRLVTSAATAD